MASTADFGSADRGSIPCSPANSWLIYECYGEDFVGCPVDDYENDVYCSHYEADRATSPERRDRDGGQVRRNPDMGPEENVLLLSSLSHHGQTLREDQVQRRSNEDPHGAE